MTYNTDYKFIELFLEMLNCYEFQLHYSGNVFHLEDLQRGNLGNIENDSFLTLQEVCERMGAYHNDYLYRAIEEDEELSIWDLACVYLVENTDNLSECNVNRFKKYLKDKKIDNKVYEEDYKIIYPDYYSTNHSYSYWHGGNVITVYSKFGTFEVDAVGDVRCSLYAKKDFTTKNGVEFKKGDLIASVRDKNNGGAFYSEFEDYIRGDYHLSNLLSDEDENMTLKIDNNNWLMLTYTDNKGNIETIDDYESLDVEDAIKYIEEIINYKKEHKNFKIFIDDIPMEKSYEI